MNIHQAAYKPARSRFLSLIHLKKFRQPLFLALVILAANRSLLIGDGIAENLMFTVDGLASGEWWRLFTYPLVHLSGYHLLLDAGAFLMLYQGLVQKRWLVRWYYCACAGAGSLALSWMVDPRLADLGLAGLSGVAHGLLAISALELLRIPGLAQWGLLSLIVVIFKSGYELYSGGVLLEAMHLGMCGTPIAACHAGGVVGALLGYGARPCLLSALRATLRPLLHPLLKLGIHTLYRIHHHDLKRIPRWGPAILVSNHVSYMDALILTALCPRPIRFVMHARFYNLPLLKGLFRLSGAISIDSAKRNPALLRNALDRISKALDQGQLVGLFPEGRLTRNGRMGPFRPGIEKIVQRNQVPVIPLALDGLWGSRFSHHRSADPKDRKLRRPVRVMTGSQVPAHKVTARHLYEKVAGLKIQERLVSHGCID